MRLLLIGGAGYIGSVLCQHLLEAGHEVVCLDRFFFGLDTVEGLVDKGLKIIRDDTRQVSSQIFENIDVVVQLAGLSNDPSADLNPQWTTSINLEGVIHAARMARQGGVKRYIFFSSCSIYGHAQHLPVTEESPCHPVSLYAKCKLEAEIELVKLASPHFAVSIMRNATVYGLSPRMRYDLIINSMTWHAFKNKKIFILGGGQQWRPLIHVKDICRAVETIMNAPTAAVNMRVFNVGSNEQNYRVHEVATKVQQMMPETVLETVPEDADKRSYNVSFDRIQSELGFVARYSPEDAIRDIRDALVSGALDADDPRAMTCKYYLYLSQTPEAAAPLRLPGRLLD